MQANRKTIQPIDINNVLAAYAPQRFNRANRAMLRELARTEAAIQAVQARIDDMQARNRQRT